MPHFKPRAMFAGSASADLFKNTLSRIPTLFGRLAYLASLRDPNSGVYKHHGLGVIFGREESRRALGDAHVQIFQQWLILSLSAKHADLSEYLNKVDDNRIAVLEYWTRAGISRSYLPHSVGAADRELFEREFAVLLETLKC